VKSLIVLGENFVNAQDTFTVSSGDATKARLYDQKQSTQWASVGSADAVTETIQIDFKDRAGAAVSRTFDRLIFLNTNLARGYVEYWNGAAWVQIAESLFTAGSPNASANLYIEMAASVSSLKVRITITHTIAAVAEKTIGEFKVCLFKVLVRHLVSFDREPWTDGGDFRLDGGGLVVFRNVTKVEASVSMGQVTQASYLILEPMVNQRQWMTWILWSDFALADTFEVVATSTLRENLDRKQYLYDLSFEVKER